MFVSCPDVFMFVLWYPVTVWSLCFMLCVILKLWWYDITCTLFAVFVLTCYVFVMMLYYMSLVCCALFRYVVVFALFGIYCVCSFFVCLFFKIMRMWPFGDMPFYVRYSGAVGSHICTFLQYLNYIADMFTLLSDIISMSICENFIMLFLDGQVL